MSPNHVATLTLRVGNELGDGTHLIQRRLLKPLQQQRLQSSRLRTRRQRKPLLPITFADPTAIIRDRLETHQVSTLAELIDLGINFLLALATFAFAFGLGPATACRR